MEQLEKCFEPKEKLSVVSELNGIARELLRTQGKTIVTELNEPLESCLGAEEKFSVVYDLYGAARELLRT